MYKPFTYIYNDEIRGNKPVLFFQNCTKAYLWQKTKGWEGRGEVRKGGE